MACTGLSRLSVTLLTHYLLISDQIEHCSSCVLDVGLALQASPQPSIPLCTVHAIRQLSLARIFTLHTLTISSNTHCCEPRIEICLRLHIPPQRCSLYRHYRPFFVVERVTPSAFLAFKVNKENSERMPDLCLQYGFAPYMYLCLGTFLYTAI